MPETGKKMKGYKYPKAKSGPSYPKMRENIKSIGRAVGSFIKNPARVPQDAAGNYKYIRTNRSGVGGTNPRYTPPKKKRKRVSAKKHKMMCKKKHTHNKRCK